MSVSIVNNAATKSERSCVDMAREIDRAAHYRARRELAYAKSLAAIEIDPQSETVILPLMSPSKAMILAKQAP